MNGAVRLQTFISVYQVVPGHRSQNFAGQPTYSISKHRCLYMYMHTCRYIHWFMLYAQNVLCLPDLPSDFRVKRDAVWFQGRTHAWWAFNTDGTMLHLAMCQPPGTPFMPLIVAKVRGAEQGMRVLWWVWDGKSGKENNACHVKKPLTYDHFGVLSRFISG